MSSPVGAPPFCKTFSALRPAQATGSLNTPASNLDVLVAPPVPRQQAIIKPRTHVNQPLQVLVVDDDADQVQMFRRFLEHYGHMVHVAGCGAAALEALATCDPELILLDLRLPDSNGCEVARAARLRFRLRCLIVAVSGYSEPGTHQSALQAGCDLFLIKPCFADTIRELLVLARLRRAGA